MKNQVARIRDFINGSNKRQFTFVALKPNAFDLTAARVVMEKLSENNLKVVWHGAAIYTTENVARHYKEIYDGYKADPEGKFQFYPFLLEYLTRGPIYGMIITGQMTDVVKFTKQLAGATKNPAPGTMRYDLAKAYGIEYDKDENGIHASGEVDEARREIANFISAYYTNLSFSVEETKKATQISNFINNYKDWKENELEK